MADLQSVLTRLDSDPDDPHVLAGLSIVTAAAAAGLDAAAVAGLAHTRKRFRDRGRPDVALRLVDAELGGVADGRRADLLIAKAEILDEDLLDEAGASACYQAALAARPDDAIAAEALESLRLARDNWKKFAAKYIDEAKASTDRQLTTALYLSAAETYARYAVDAPEVEAYLRRSLEADPRNRKAGAHLERLLARGERWAELGAALAVRVDHAASSDERVAALLALAEVTRGPLDQPERALEHYKKVVAIDAAQPTALRVLGDAFAEAENWQSLVMLYASALKVRGGDGDLGMLLQVGMILWKRLGDQEGAEDYFRRIRKLDAAHPVALDFYRTYHGARGEGAKLVAILRQAEKALPPVGADGVGDARARALAVEIAELSETQLGTPDKAIDAWKQLLRADPTSTEAREALRRLYRKAEKWNPLLDLIKDEVERLPEADVRAKVERLYEVVAIYADKLRLDPMVLNTYNAILRLDPEDPRAIDELAAKYRAMGRWQDLIGVLGKKAELASLPVDERAAILRETADLWIDRFGNYAQAIRPLERLLELDASDADAVARLKDIYTRRRQWRQLITLLGVEAEVLTGVERRAKRSEMARLAAERVGDTRLAIEIHNQVLTEAGVSAGGAGTHGDGLDDTYAALAALYEREKRYPALAEVLGRLRLRTATPTEAVALLEKQGALLADRMSAPALAAEAFAAILAIDPTHAKALRTLRELYAAAGDWDGLERLYGGLGQWDELVDALIGLGDRADDRDARLALVRRAAAIATARQEPERAARVWERVLSIEPTDAVAARALVPAYLKSDKPAKLLPVYEVLLAHAPDRAARLAQIVEIRSLCEQRLGSRALALSWTARAFDLAPEDPELVRELLRLAQVPEHWREVAGALDRKSHDLDLATDVRLRLLRTLAEVHADQLDDAAAARDAHQHIRALAPDDAAAETAIERLSEQMSDWPELLASFRRQAERARGDDRRRLLGQIAQVEEERLADLDAAALTHQQILREGPGDVAALAALARLHEARGDWEALAGVLAAQIDGAAGPARAALQHQLGTLVDGSLERPADALAHYRAALAAVDGGAPPANLVAACVRYLPGGARAGSIDDAQRRALAAELRPHLVRAGEPAPLVACLECLASDPAAPADVARELDRQLVPLYHALGAPARAWAPAARVVASAPGDVEARAALIALADQLGRPRELATHLGDALAAQRQAGAPAVELWMMATELAHRIADDPQTRGGAEKAWMTVLELEPDDAEAFGALAALYRTGSRWDDLRALLERRVSVAADPAARLAALIELTTLDEDVLGDPGRAVLDHRRILEIEAGHLPSYKALERLYAEGESWAELDGVLAAELAWAPASEHQGLRYRRAELHARHLGDRAGAIDLLEEVVAAQPGHADGRELLEEQLTEASLRQRVARVLEPLYLRDQLWKDLANVLRIQREGAAGADAAQLLGRVAVIEERELDLGKAAFDTWTQALTADPSAPEAQAAILRLAATFDRWHDAAVAFDAAATAAGGDLAVAVPLRQHVAEICDQSLGDNPRAIAAYRALISLDPGDLERLGPALTALARLHEEEEQWPELRAVVARQAELAGPRRLEFLARAAELDEQRLAEPDRAIATWREVLLEAPDHEAALANLERLYQARDRWRDFAGLVRHKVERADDQATKIAELRRLAEVHEVMLAEPSEAIVAHLEVLDHVYDDTAALDELARLYREAQRPTDQLDMLERRLIVADARGDGDRVTRRAELATLLGTTLARPNYALDRWAEVLTMEPEHPAALAAVGRAFDDPDLAPRAAAILEPLYEATGKDRELTALLAAAARREVVPRERARLWTRVAAIQEHRLTDRAAAFDAAVAALRASVAEPELPEAIGLVDRLAGDLEREGDLVAIYRSIADDVLDGAVQRRLFLDIADLAQAAQGDLDLARAYYQRVLDAQADDARALGALERIYKQRLAEGATGDAAPLYDILSRKADLAVADVVERTAALAEMATLAAGPLARPDDAIAAWEQVLEAQPRHPTAAPELDRMYRGERRWRDLVDLHERRLGFVDTIEEAITLRVKLGALHEHELGDVTTAIESYAAALGGDPGHAGAIAALERLLTNPEGRADAAEVLEPVYISRHDWTRLARLYEIQLDGQTEPDARVDLVRRIARLYEEQLEDLDGAARWYARLLQEDPTDPHVRDQLHRLATVGGDWAGLAATYQRVLDDDSSDAPHLRELAVAAATIYDRRLDEAGLGGAAYRRALAATPPAGADDRLALLARVESLLGRHLQWATLVAIYDDVIGAVASDDALRRDLYARKAAVVEERLGDPAAAIDAWRAVIELADGLAARLDYARAADALERLYRADARWHDLVDLLSDRIERASNEGDEIDRRLALAEVLELHTDDLDGALDQYEEILTTDTPDRALPALERLAAGAAGRERTLGLIEPIYRHRNWWQKLVVVLDAKLEFVSDPSDQVATLMEIAAIHESRGGDLDLALAALARAWLIEPTRTDVFDQLTTLGARMGAWDALCQTLAAGAAATMDPPTQLQALARLAEIHETQRGDHGAAIAAWRRVLEVSADDPDALSALDRLLAVEARADELVVVVARRAELADDEAVRLVLLHRVASLYDHVLERAPQAILAYREVLAGAPEDVPALAALERLYRASGDARELAVVLEQRLALTDDAAAARQLRLDLATVHERDLSDPYQAIANLEAVLAADAGDATGLAELDRLYGANRMWPELLDVLDRRALLATDTAARAELAYRAARLGETELGEPEVALGRYGAVLQILPTHAAARTALEALLAKDDHAEAAAALLERHLRAVGDAEGLVRVAERRLELPGERAQRRNQWAALADLHETLRNDLRAASQTWARALVEDPTDVGLLGPLERLAQVRGAWAELAALLEGQLAGTALDAELEHDYAMRLGRIYEEALADLARAATTYQRAAATNVDEPPALAALDRVLWRLGRWSELAEVLAREAEVAEGDAAGADLLFRLGDVRESQLQDVAGAVDAYRSVIERAPRHGAARASLERLLASADDQRGEIIDTLEPLYEGERDWGRLTDLLAAKLAVTDDHHERAAIYQRIAGLAETRLGDGVRALDAAGGWLAEDPASAEALAEIDRLAALQGRWVEAAARVAGVAGTLDDGAVPLWMYVGAVQLDRVGDTDAARGSFERALALDDEHGPALEGLERIHRSRGDTAGLAEVLARRATLAFDPPAKQALWTEVAGLRERAGDDGGAIAAWEAVIDVADDDREPLARLAAIYERQGDRRALVTTLGRAARIAADAVEEKRLRVRIAELERALGDLAAAGVAWQAVLDLDPVDAAALTALEELHTAGRDWIAVQDVLTRRLELARTSSDKIAVLARMARIAERERGALDDAIAHWYAALDVDNAQLAAYGELERLLAKGERWHDLVELLDRRADLHGTLGDAAAEIGALARAADIWEGPLDNPDAGAEILEKILRREPTSVAALTRLGRIYERAADWDRCGDVLSRALALGPKGTDAADLFFRLGEVADKAQDDRATAQAHYRQALTHDPRHAPSIAALERLARADGNWAVVSDMLARQIAIVEADGGDVLPLALEYAAAEQKLGTPAAALAVLERAAAAAPGDARVLTLLADLYFASGQHDQAAPIYDRLADDAKAARRMKDVARFRQRQGGILEARGDVAGAVAAYEEAFRVNPTDVPTMAGLGRLAMSQRDWEKARRVYRSLVLQNLDADAGLTKADVYYALGVIHDELGEAPKAKGMFQRGLEVDPTDQRLKDALARHGTS
ncbi:MAG: tetratricopeptide repeat protein [Myxococcales bacterium]|nr:tetratricopeptide repeat protein [Myxococcales bacterium]